MKTGFTLIELIIVVAVLTLLAVILVPNYLSLMTKAMTASEIAFAAEWANAINLHNAIAHNSQSVIITVINDGTLSSEPSIIANLKPIAEIEDPDKYVFPRITISGGIATVTNLRDLHS